MRRKKGASTANVVMYKMKEWKLNLTQGGEHHQHHPHPRPLVNEPISHGSSRQWFGYKDLRGGVHPIWTPPRTRRCSNSIREEKTWVLELEEELTF